MKITLIGKAHREGTSSRTGRPYNINTVYYNSKMHDVDGLAALSATISGAEYPYDAIRIGGDYVIEYDAGGHLIAFDAVEGKPAAGSSNGNSR